MRIRNAALLILLADKDCRCLASGEYIGSQGSPSVPVSEQGREQVRVCDGTVLRQVGEVPSGAADSQTPADGKQRAGQSVEVSLGGGICNSLRFPNEVPAPTLAVTFAPQRM